MNIDRRWSPRCLLARCLRVLDYLEADRDNSIHARLAAMYRFGRVPV